MLVIDDVAIEPPAPGHLLPPAAFTSPAVFELEQRAIFARSWVHVADLIDVPQPGDYATAKIGRTPVIVLRDRKTGELRAFLNACRHRGAQLLEGRGTCDKQIKCPYHAWSYGTDGALLGVPYREDFSADVSGLGLVPVRVGTCGPLIFACLDAAAPPLAEWLGSLPAALAAAATWDFAWELRYDVAINWKIFVENANDGYHVPFVHDLLTDLLVPESGTTTLEPHGAFSLASVSAGYLPPGVDSAQIRFGAIFPNFIPVISPSDLTYIRVDPIAHDRLALFVRSYDSPELAHLRELRKLTFEHTTKQDLAVVTRVQAGLQAHGLPAGVHAGVLEERIGHFERVWAEALIADAAPKKRHLAIAP